MLQLPLVSHSGELLVTGRPHAALDCRGVGDYPVASLAAVKVAFMFTHLRQLLSLASMFVQTQNNTLLSHVIPAPVCGIPALFP